MRERYVRIEAPNGGNISILQGYRSTVVECRWLADAKDGGGWINVNLSLDSRDYLSGIRRLWDNGSGHITSIGGVLILESQGNRTRLTIIQSEPSVAISYLSDLPPHAFGPDLDE